MMGIKNPNLHSKHYVKTLSCFEDCITLLFLFPQGFKKSSKLEKLILPHHSFSPKDYGTAYHFSLFKVVFKLGAVQKLKNYWIFCGVELIL